MFFSAEVSKSARVDSIKFAAVAVNVLVEFLVVTSAPKLSTSVEEVIDAVD